MSTVASPASEPNPLLVWETFNAYQRTAALRAAIELDLFTAVGEGATTSEDLSRRCNASPRGTRILCDYLTIIGFLSKNADTYALGRLHQHPETHIVLCRSYGSCPPWR